MDNGHYSDSENRPLKRARRTPSPSSSNGHPSTMPPNSSALPPLSLSILGVEPLDEFIVEVADFIHHMIRTKPEGPGLVEVEAKVGVLRDKGTGQRLQLPILVETSKCHGYPLSFAVSMKNCRCSTFTQLYRKPIRVQHVTSELFISSCYRHSQTTQILARPCHLFPFT